jgi:hypothetical protein
MLPNLGTTGSQFEELLVPNVVNNASQSWNYAFLVLGTSSSQACSQTLEPMLPNLGTADSQF